MRTFWNRDRWCSQVTDTISKTIRTFAVPISPVDPNLPATARSGTMTVARRLGGLLDQPSQESLETRCQHREEKASGAQFGSRSELSTRGAEAPLDVLCEHT